MNNPLNQDADSETIELSIEQAKEKIDLNSAFTRLTENPDWDLIMEQGYFDKYPKELVFMKADPGMSGEAQQRDINDSLMAISQLRQFLINIRREGQYFATHLKDLQEEQALRMQEGLEGDE